MPLIFPFHCQFSWLNMVKPQKNHHYSRTRKLQKTPFNLFLIFSNANPFLGAMASPSAPSIGTQGKQSCTGIFKGVERIDSNVEPLRLALIDPNGRQVVWNFCWDPPG
jgi:hypothetical protein